MEYVLHNIRLGLTWFMEKVRIGAGKVRIGQWKSSEFFKIITVLCLCHENIFP